MGSCYVRLSEMEMEDRQAWRRGDHNDLKGSEEFVLSVSCISLSVRGNEAE